MICSYVLPEDLPALVPMVNAAYRGEASKQGWTTEANIIAGEKRTDLQQLQQMMADPNAVFIKVTDEAGNIVGSVFLHHQPANGLYLGMLSVWPHMQGHGIGKMLIQAAETHARNVGASRIFMTVISARTELIAWYQSLGYVITPERKPFEVDPEYGVALQPLEFLVLDKWVG
jgi:ribosomal protein S18 acetylase RimI-like enzyme